ncbi:MAG: hypothetical protein L0Y72_11540 [Gemmataceae bacterium]|nr:hypothetical protein [Gemmataceae bacterium]MCI0739670.1 hypothetical protein [Gemmataceae bacterium]
MRRTFCWSIPCLGLCLALLAANAGEGKYSIKVGDNPPPNEIAESIRKLLAPQSIQLLDGGGKTLCELWFRKEIPADATPEQIKNGLTYREIKQSEVLGAVKFEQDYRDYRKQKVKAGSYTLRLAYQPMDGDHTGASEHLDFLAVIDASKDTKPEIMDAKHLSEVSAKSIGTGHPGVFMLFPHTKPGAKPALAAMPKEHWVVQTKGEIVVGGKSTGTSLGIALTLVGAAE